MKYNRKPCLPRFCEVQQINEILSSQSAARSEAARRYARSAVGTERRLAVVLKERITRRLSRGDVRDATLAIKKYAIIFEADFVSTGNNKARPFNVAKSKLGQRTATSALIFASVWGGRK